MKKLIQTLLAVTIFNTAFAQLPSQDLRKAFLARIQPKQAVIANKTTALCLKDSMIILNGSNTNSWQNASRYYYAYNPVLDMNASIISGWNGNAWYLNTKITTTYDNNHHPLINLRQNLNGSAPPSNSSLNTKTYDGNGNLLTELYQYWSSITNTWINSSKYTHTYDPGNNELTYYSQIWNTSTSTWKDSYKSIYTYSGNNMTSEILQGFNSTINALENEWKYTNTYDIFNKLISGFSFVWNPLTSAWDNDEKYSASYSGNNMTLVTALTWNSTSNSWVNGYKYTYTYDANNNQTSELDESYDYNTNTWITDHNYIMTYDNNNNQLSYLSQVWDQANSILKNNNRTTNTYDANNNELTDLYESWQSNAWKKDQLTSSYYNCTTVGLKELQKSNSNVLIYPNPALSELFIKTNLEYAAIHILNSNGREVGFSKENEKSIFVLNLAPGIYFVQVFDKSGKILATEKFIKE